MSITPENSTVALSGSGLSETNRFLQRAVQLSAEGHKSGLGGAFGAVIVRNGMIIAESCNRAFQKTDPTAHAEMEAIREACRILGEISLKDTTLYASSEPCPMCLSAIYWAEIGTVYYANSLQQTQAAGLSDSTIYRELCTDLPNRTVTMIQLPNTEAEQILRDWTASQV